MKTRNLTFLAATLTLIVASFSLMSKQGSREEQAIRLTPPDRMFSFVRSMEGTSVDGQATQADDGNLVVNAELRLMFDYYLAATGEKSIPDIKREIENVLDQKLKPHAAAQAKELLTRYLGYKQALLDLEKNSGASATSHTNNMSNDMIAAMQKRWQSMQKLRLQFFSAKDNQALFGFDDAYDMDALARLEISQNPAYSDQQKQEKLQALDATMSQELREAKSAPYQIIRLEEQAQQLRSSGASEDDIYRMRAAAVSPEAANRLADLDREEAKWKTRIASYLEQRRQLLSRDDNKNTTEKNTALQQLRDRYFNIQEQNRLAAYE
ncbi:lipase chaperone [Undibacterium sp. FT147W]|uniref:Lipase helper protein n=1 Tax=Undibacterium rivi TaxID=2828729 RepID=A0ABS5GZ37_9BURK|nr:lipase secretion chaperone [Undibacterium rivi]MBR7791628.1 lipase chaperone [Undibacterium rivi]